LGTSSKVELSVGDDNWNNAICAIYDAENQRIVASVNYHYIDQTSDNEFIAAAPRMAAIIRQQRAEIEGLREGLALAHSLSAESSVLDDPQILVTKLREIHEQSRRVLESTP
jgi:hypothetical protein